MRRFVHRAYRQPSTDADADRFLPIVRSAIKAGYNFTDAMIVGYTGVLCSPGFLYLEEKPGRIDRFRIGKSPRVLPLEFPTR